MRRRNRSSCPGVRGGIAATTSAAYARMRASSSGVITGPRVEGCPGSVSKTPGAPGTP